MTTIIDQSHGRYAWGSERDDEGHRTYMLTHLIRSTDPGNDGPAAVMQTSGIPAIGSTWNFGNDVDIWAFCTPYMRVTEHQKREGERSEYYRLDQKFTTKPFRRCQDTSIEDPLLEPMKISGSFSRYSKEGVLDRFGNYLRSSSHEQFRGPQVEFDDHKASVHIEQNVLLLQLGTFTAMVNRVNDGPLWGLPARCIKLGNATWERKYYGVCYVYYTRSFDFDIDFYTFDRDVADEGTKCLRGQWIDNPSSTGTAIDTWQLINIGSSPPDPDNPSHFDRYKDRNGENARVILDGRGLPAGVTVGSGTGTYQSGGPASVRVEYYKEANFLDLGIPVTLA